MQLKKILAIFLAATLIFSATSLIGVAETNNETLKVGVEAETATPISTIPQVFNQGEEVSIKISVDQNTGISSLRFVTYFDADALELVDFTSEKLFGNSESIKVYDNYVIFFVLFDNVNTATGDLFTLNFKTKVNFCDVTKVYTELANDADDCVRFDNDFNTIAVPFVADYTEFAIHSIVKEDGVVTDPTCLDEGYTTYKCNACEQDIVGNIVPALGHDPAAAVEENRVEPTCTVDGNYDTVVYCSRCSEELSRENIIIPMLGHTSAAAVEENRVEPTCTVDGKYDTVIYCATCDEELSRETITIPMTGHAAGEAVEENRVEPDCVTDGSYDTVVYCDTCDEELSRETIVLPKLGHTAGVAVEENRVEPDCVTDGSYDTVVYCSVCNAELTRETVVIPKLGHTEATAVVENRVEPDCVTDGSYDSVVYCSVCNDELLREKKTIPMLGHDLKHTDAKAPTCTEIGWDAYDTCQRNGCDYTTYNELKALGHKEAEAVEENRKESTPTEKGSYDMVVYCSVCNAELSRKTETIPYFLGDVNVDEEVTSDDAVQLLYNTLLPEEYPVYDYIADFNGDGEVTSDDAVYLLYYTLLPEEYPIPVVKGE